MPKVTFLLMIDLFLINFHYSWLPSVCCPCKSYFNCDSVSLSFARSSALNRTFTAASLWVWNSHPIAVVSAWLAVNEDTFSLRLQRLLSFLCF